MASIIEAKNLKIALNELVLFENLNFEIESEKITIILGPNGSGKTTLLKAFSDVIKPSCGELKIEEKSSFYLPQKISYPNELTLFEYLSSIFFKEKWKWYLKECEKLRIDEVLAELELLEKKDVKLEYLSSGELQKANIALGLLSGAKLLLLDEPTSNMDLVNQIKILDILRRLKEKGITIIVILHDLNLASNYGDNFIGVNGAHEMFLAKRADFFKEDILGKVFNLKFRVVDGEKSFFIQSFN